MLKRYKVIIFDLLLGFNEATIPWNDMFVIYG